MKKLNSLGKFLSKLKILTHLGIGTLAFAASHAFAQSTASVNQAQTANRAPVCTPLTVDIGSLPAGANFTSVSIDPVKAGVCTDPDGDKLTLVADAKLAPVSASNEVIAKQTLKAAGQSTTVTYTVTDGKGGKASSTITIKRS